MKYAIWRHENALGNSAEHTINIAKHIKRINDKDPHIYVETDFQRCFALCIPGITPNRVHFFRPNTFKDIGTSKTVEHVMNENINSNEEYKDIHFPTVYAYKNPSYKGQWGDLKDDPDITLKFPYKIYNNKHNLPSNAIVVHIRERGTYYKRWDGANAEPQRFVNPQIIFNVMIFFAEQGYPIIRLGDPNQTPAPKHPNIIDFTRVKNRNMLDDLYTIDQSSVFLSTDSGIWPMAGGMKKNLVLSNITSVFFNPREDYLDVVNWLPEETTTLLFKDRNTFKDNNENELINAISNYLI